MVELKRMTAVKVLINEIISGRYFSGGREQSYVLTYLGRRISRVRILGTVVSKFISPDKGFGVITIDDGSGTIRAKSFEKLENLKNIDEGDIVDLVGKIREYGGELYVLTEVIHKIVDPNWEILRLLEIKNEIKKWNELKNKVIELQKQASDISELRMLAKKNNLDPDIAEDIAVALEEIPEPNRERTPEEIEAKKEILNLIAELDKGEGADYSDIVAKSKYDEDMISSVVNDLLSEGSCFEPRPGKIKKL